MSQSPPPTRGVRVRRSRALLVAALLGAMVALQLPTAPVALAAEPVTYAGPTYPTAGPTGTEDKPQSKLWHNDGSWWALMRTTQGVTIHQLVGHTWRDTGTVVDERQASTGDALWEGGRLFVASRVANASGASLRLIQFSYDAPTDTWTRTHNTQITSGGSESITVARDSLSRLWITYTRGSRVYVAHTTNSAYTAWTAPFLLPVPDNAVSSDDISAIIALPGKIGVMWSDQASDAMRFAVHKDTDPVDLWTVEDAYAGTDFADDHINLKSLLEDDAGRTYAAIKTSLAGSADPSIVVLQRSASGQWTSTVAATKSTGLTRPQLALDRTNRHVYALMATEGGGTVYYKRSPLGALDFGSPTAKGAPFVQQSGARINDPSTSKQPVDASTGLVVLASDDISATKRYYHGELALGSAPPPAGDTTAPTAPTGLSATAAGPSSVDLTWGASSDAVGVTGYRVFRGSTQVGTTSPTTRSFTDTGLTASTTYSYTVRAVDAANNVSGPSNTATATTSAASTPPPTDPGDPAGSGFVGVATAAGATTSTTVAAPSGSAAGQVLVAVVAARGRPIITPPAGWELVRQDVNSSTLRQEVFVRVATGNDASTWTLSSAQSHTIQVLAYAGIDTSAPVAAHAGALSTSAPVVSPAVSSAPGPVLAFAAVPRTADLTGQGPLTDRGEIGSASSTTYKVTSNSADASGTPGPFSTNVSTNVAGIGATIALRPGAGSAPPPAGDTTAPTAPTGLSATAAGPSSVDLTWGASSDAVGVTGYRVFRGSTQVGTTSPTTRSFTDTGLTASTTYSYTVRAVDAANNVSGPSNTATATTSAASTPPPTDPTDPGDPAGSGFVGVATAAGATTSTTVAAPSGSAAGQVLVAVVAARGRPIITPPAGWELVRQDVNSSTLRQEVFVRVATGNDASTWTLSSAQSHTIQVLAYAGIDTSAPVAAHAGALSTSAPVVSPAVSSAPGPVLAFAAVPRTADLTGQGPLTDRGEIGSASSTTYKVTSNSADASGTPGPFSTNVSSNVAGIGATIALRPGSGAATP